MRVLAAGYAILRNRLGGKGIITNRSVVYGSIAAMLCDETDSDRSNAGDVSPIGDKLQPRHVSLWPGPGEGEAGR